jgi:hypothetical protein
MEEADSKAVPGRGWLLKRVGVTAALVTGLIAGGYGIAAAASPSPTSSISSSNSSGSGTHHCPHMGSSGTSGAASGASYTF